MTRSRDVADTQDNLGGAVAPLVAGKNKVINGSYDYWQRATTFTSVGAGNYYTADRWKAVASVTTTMSQNVIAPGTSGLDQSLKYGIDLTGGTVSTGGYYYWSTPIEDVRTLANTTATLSFYAKGSVAGTIATRLTQYFGTGGSTAVYCANANTGVVGAVFNLTTSWQKFTATFTIPSVNGKTISATDSFLELTFVKGLGSSYTPTTFGIPSAVDYTGTLSITGVQLEAGSVATPFTTASGSIGGELALCQRYYLRYTQSVSYERLGNGFASATNAAVFQIPLKVTMRTAATSVDYNAMTAYDGANQSGVGVVALNASSANVIDISLTSISGLTQFRPYAIIAGGTSGAYLGFSAEL
jgi:hypothetical protein